MRIRSTLHRSKERAWQLDRSTHLPSARAELASSSPIAGCSAWLKRKRSWVESTSSTFALVSARGSESGERPKR